MADETQNLNITISAQDAGATAILADVQAKIAAIEGEMRTMGASSAAAAERGAAGFTTLQGAASRAGGEFGSMAESTRKVSGEIERAAAEGGPFLGFLADASEHSRQFSMALDAMGAHSAQAAERVAGLGQFFVGLGDAAPQIIAIGAAVAGLAAAFEFTKGAISSAADLQQSMDLLGQSVKNQGGDWQTLSKTVEDFAETQERTTIFSNVEVIKSLNLLASTGVSVKDSMTIVRVAEDAAAATGHSLTDVVHGLMEAEAGRTQVLAQLGLATRAQIKDGMSLDDILRAIEMHMGGAAATAAQTYQGSLSALGAAWEHLLQDIGTPFLEVLTNVAHGMTEVVNAIDSGMQPALTSLAQWFTAHQNDISAFFLALRDAALKFGQELHDDIIPAAQNLWSALGNLVNAFGNVTSSLTGEKDGWTELNDSIRDASKFVSDLMNDLAQLIRVLGDTSDEADSAWSSVDDAMQPVLRTLGLMDAAVALVAEGFATLARNEQAAQYWHGAVHGGVEEFKGRGPGPGSAGGWGGGAAIGSSSAGSWGPPTVSTTTQFNPQIGGTGGAGSGFTPPVIQDVIDKMQLEAQVEQQNEAVTNALTDAKDRAAQVEAQLAADVKAATTVAGEQAAQAALDSQKIADLAQQHKILNEAVYNETQTLKTATTAQAAARSEYESSRSAVQAWASAHAGAKNISESEKETYEQLKAALQQAQAKYDDARGAVKSLTEEIRQHREEIARDAAEQLALASASRDAAASAARDWDKFLVDEQQKYKDDMATFQMTSRQKVEYYAEGLAEQQSLAKDNEAKLAQLYQEELQAFRSAQFDKVAALQQAMAQISSQVEQEYNLMKQYDENELSSYKEMLQQEIDARKAAIQQEESDVKTFLDDLLADHKSFAAAFKSIMQSTFKDWIDAMSTAMFAGEATTGPQSGISQFFSGLLGGISSKQEQATQQFSTSTTQFQTAVAEFQSAVARVGASGAGGGIATYPTPSGNALVTYTGGADAEELSNDFSATTSSSSGSGAVWMGGPGSGTWTVPFNVPNSWNAAQDVTSVNDINDIPFPSSVTSSSSAISSALSKYGSMLQEALMGYMMGQSINSLENPNEMPGQSSGIWAGIGGAAGDIFGTMFGGPVGGFLGSIVGSLFGGLFGSHETAAQMPDVSEPNYGTPWSYGQFVSNMIGTYGTYNGQYIQAQAPYNQYEGGTPMGQQVFNELADLPKNLSPVVENLANQLRALERGDTNPNALEIKSESQGMFTLESGAQISVQQYMQEIGQFMAATAGMIPTFTLTRTYPNFNKSTLTQTGEYDPTVSYGAPPPGGTPPPYYGQGNYPGTSGGSSSGAAQRPIQIGPIVINGNVLDQKVPDALALAVAQALQRLDLGTAAGGLNQRLGTAVSGGDYF